MKRDQIINELENVYKFENKSNQIKDWYTLRTEKGIIYDCIVREKEVAFYVEIDNMDLSMVTNEFVYSFNQITPYKSPVNTIFQRFNRVKLELIRLIAENIADVEKSIHEIKPDRIAIKFQNGAEISSTNDCEMKSISENNIVQPFYAPSFSEIKKQLLPDQINDLVEAANKHIEYRIKK